MNKPTLYRVVAIIVFVLIAIKVFSVLHFFISAILTLLVIGVVGHWIFRKLLPRAG